MHDACWYCHRHESLRDRGGGHLMCSDCGSVLDLAYEGVGLYFLLFYLLSGVSWAVLAVGLLLARGPLAAVVLACLLVPTWILWRAADKAGLLDGFIRMRLRSPRSRWERIDTLEFAVLGSAGVWLGLVEGIAVARLV